MITFDRSVKISDIQDDYTREDLIEATNEAIDYVLELIRDLPDSYVTFQPVDHEAYDPAAATQGEMNIAWTLGHVVVHMTATSEEAAARASMLARGVVVEQRMRSEVPWETVTTVQQLIDRLEESRRMQLAYLDAWPDEPNLEIVYELYERWAGRINAVGMMLSGLAHDQDHYKQLAEIIRQAQDAGV
ncbi:MAG: DinB family protein [Chloroflexi bacterium]|nr:DinB family protein [Chloroflexota bacterium]